jgi:hypothetical protein
MKHGSFIKTQRGATLIVSLIMLVLITLLVTSAFTLSTTSLQSVGNMQSREEAVAAANKAIEQVLSSPFTDDPAGEAIDVDINNDDVRDYEVTIDTPTCVSAEQVAATSIPPSSLSLGGFFSSAVSHHYQTVWDINANVMHPATGTSVRVRQGVRVLLSQLQYDAVCT